MPDGAWQIIHADFYGPLPTGHYIIVLTDKYSRYPETEIINSISAKTSIPKLDAFFARRGIPHTFKSDNGPPFNGNYLPNKTGYQTRDINTRLAIKKIPENYNWVQELSRFLVSYSTTPHSSTNIPPAQFLLNRPVRT